LDFHRGVQNIIFSGLK